MKKIIAIALLALLSLSACDLVAPLLNPVIGTWEVTVLGVTTRHVLSADNSRVSTVTVLGVGVSTDGTWSSDGTTLTRTTSGTPDETDFYSFNSDKTTMTLSPTAGGLSLTYTRL